MTAKTIVRSIFIHAPVQTVFNFWSEPKNHRDICPGLIEIAQVEPLPSGGYSYEWVVKLAGFCFKGHSDWTEFEKDRRIFIKNDGEMVSTFDYKFQPETDGSLVIMHIEYTFPSVLLEEVAEATVEKMHANEAEVILANLKARME
jgi:uncharacterized membrane protein